jgi:putative hydrolase of the HAD superfamily
VQAVLFDLWETLITDAPELQRARQLWRAANVRAVLDADGITVEVDVLDKALSNILPAVSLMHDSGIDTDAAGRIAMFVSEFEKLSGMAPEAKTHAALEEAICTMSPGIYPLAMPGALETLAAIKAQGLKTALVSNAGVTTAPTLREMLSHYGLLPHLDALIFSDELKLGKPSAGMFTAALEALGCQAADAVFVGDSPVHDIAGAKAVGMATVQIGSKHVEGIVPDAQIESLGELVDVLAGLDPRLISLNRAGG